MAMDHAEGDQIPATELGLPETVQKRAEGEHGKASVVQVFAFEPVGEPPDHWHERGRHKHVA